MSPAPDIAYMCRVVNTAKHYDVKPPLLLTYTPESKSEGFSKLNDFIDNQLALRREAKERHINNGTARRVAYAELVMQGGSLFCDDGGAWLRGLKAVVEKQYQIKSPEPPTHQHNTMELFLLTPKPFHAT